MFGKLLLTAAIIAGVLLFLKQRARGPVRPEAVARNDRRPSSPAPPSPLPRLMAYSFLALMLAASVFFVYTQWQDRYRVVNIRVINANTGDSVLYQARRGDIRSRSFETLDGRLVNLAGVERMEIGGR